jgi:hypothetical protein
MSNTSEVFLGFLVTLHVLLFFAGANGLITTQQGENPHKKVIDTFENPNDLSQKGQVSESSGIIEQTFSPVLAVSGLVNSLVGILSSPYTSIQATQLPALYQSLFTSLLGLFEIITVYRVATGRL